MSFVPQLSHKPSKASAAQIRRLASLVDPARLWETHLQPILIERLPGTRGSLAVQQVCDLSQITSSCFLKHRLFIFNSLLCFSTSRPPCPRCRLAGPLTWTLSSLPLLVVKSPLQMLLPFWTPQPLGGSSWPAIMTQKSSLQTRRPQGRCFWEPAILLFPVL